MMKSFAVSMVVSLVAAGPSAEVNVNDVMSKGQAAAVNALNHANTVAANRFAHIRNEGIRGAKIVGQQVQARAPGVAAFAATKGKDLGANIVRSAQETAPAVGQKIKETAVIGGAQIAQRAPVVAGAAQQIASQLVSAGTARANDLIKHHGGKQAKTDHQDPFKTSEIESDVSAFKKDNTNFLEDDGKVDPRDFASSSDTSETSRESAAADDELSKSAFVDSQNLAKAALSESFASGHMLSAVFGVMAARLFL